MDPPSLSPQPPTNHLHHSTCRHGRRDRGRGDRGEEEIDAGKCCDSPTFPQRFGFCFNWKEIKLQFTLAAPMITLNLLGYSLGLISLMFVGHIGELELAGASLAAAIANVTGSSLLMGMACALETLCGQAYGARQYQQLGIYMQRGILVLNVIAIVPAVVWANIDRLLVALGQDQEISSFAGTYVCWLIPTLFACATTQPLVKFLQTQSLVIPLAWTGLGTLCCHIPICWVLVYKSGLGFAGAALANGISNWINVLLLSAYVRFSPACSKTRAAVSWEALYELKAFLKLALPSAAMICLEWWAYEFFIILSGLLPDPELQTSTLNICSSTSALVYMVPYGVSAAASTRVSNELGAGRPQAARAASIVSLGLGASVAVILATLVTATCKVWTRAYSDEEEVINYAASLMPFLAVSTVVDSVAGVISGVIRGAGWQKIGAFINLGAYFVVGLPIGTVLAFVTYLSGKGLVIGGMCGTCAQLALLAYISSMADWDEAAKQAVARVDSSFVSTTEPLLSSGEK